MDCQKEYDRIVEKIGKDNIILSFLRSENGVVRHPNTRIEYKPTGKLYHGDIFDDECANALYAIKQLEKDLK